MNIFFVFIIILNVLTKWIYVMALDGTFLNKYLEKGGSLGDVPQN
jgi:hypothetical protein